MSHDLETAPYRDPNLPLDERVSDLLARMTLDEKIAQLSSVWLALEPGSGEFAPAQQNFMPEQAPDDLVDLGIGQLTRPFGSRPIDAAEGARALNEFQRRQVEETRLGIPTIPHEECLTGFVTLGATQFPSPLNYGATWDPTLIGRAADVIRRQMCAVGSRQGLSPVADVIRDPRWGRVEECVAEDPYLVGCIVSAYVQGLQGQDLRNGVAATLKHFAGYSGSEGGRNVAPTHVGPRELADVYLLPFEMAIKAGGARSVMNSYQENDGIPSAANRELLTEILRDRWGFDGVVVADYFAVKFLEKSHRVAADEAEAAALALCAGLDVELPSPQCFPGGLQEALERGLASVADVDRAVGRHLRLKFELGLFENPTVDVDSVALDGPADQALAQEIAEKSLTLLVNDGTLPLSNDVTRLAVIGPNADDPMALFGNYSFQNHVASHFPDHPLAPVPTVLEHLRDRLGSERVTHTQGCEVLSDDTSGIAAAVTLASEAEVAVLILGDKAGHFRRGSVGEGTDTDDLTLPGAQQALLDAVVATGTPTVVVLVNGRPFAMPGIAEHTAAVLESWFPGQAGGAAIVRALFGDLNPGGKTTVTFSQGAGVQPRVYNHKPTSPGFVPGPFFAPVFPFGHGLSYTTFEYTDLTLESEQVPVDGVARIGLTVRNSGKRSGDEVVQLYIRDEVGSVARPVLELKGFHRLTLEPGAAKRLEFALPADMLSFTGVDGHRIVEPGGIQLFLGASSTDIRLETRIELTGATRRVPEDRALFSSVEASTA